MRGLSRRGRPEVPLLLCSILMLRKTSHSTPGCSKCKFPGGVPLLDSPGPPPVWVAQDAAWCAARTAVWSALLRPSWSSQAGKSPCLFTISLLLSQTVSSLQGAGRGASGKSWGITASVPHPPTAGSAAELLSEPPRKSCSPPWWISPDWNKNAPVWLVSLSLHHWSQNNTHWKLYTRFVLGTEEFNF